MADDSTSANKAHASKHSGAKANKNKKDKQSLKGRNPKAFAFASVGKTLKNERRNQDKEQKRLHVPQVDRSPLDQPPVIVAVVGPPKVIVVRMKNAYLPCLFIFPIKEIKH